MIRQRLLSVLDRFVIVDDRSGCWVFTGGKNHHGYGLLGYQRDGKPTSMMLHRATYLEFVGPIPDGLVLDHLCRIRACCNPGHLEPVTHRENLHRSPLTASFQQSQMTHCRRGHEFTAENTYRYGSHRRCKTCIATWKSAARKAAA